MRISLLFVLISLAYEVVVAQQAGKEKPFVLGHILELNSRELGETRILNIYLPEGYSSDDTVHYPVIYLLDGGADEDFIHVAGIIQFDNFPWINRVPRSIVVGIANTDRKRDFTFPTSIEADRKDFPTTGKSSRFIAFIENELQPFIEQKYRTSVSKTIIGQSLGGLLATEILLTKPQLFDQYIIISPSLWWDDGSLLKKEAKFLNPGFTQKIKVYIAVGKEGKTPGHITHVMETDANRLLDKIRKSQPKDVSVHFDYLPEENHATISHQAIFNAFKKLYPPQAEEKQP
jgi:hypothetical protein